MFQKTVTHNMRWLIFICSDTEGWPGSTGSEEEVGSRFGWPSMPPRARDDARRGRAAGNARNFVTAATLARLPWVSFFDRASSAHERMKDEAA